MPTLRRARLRVLVIEDHEFVRAFVVQSLWQLGYEAVAAGTGAQALQLVHGGRRPFDLLLIDIVLPDCDSAELVRQLRHVLPGFKLVLMSGYPFPFCYRGAFVFLPKPFTLQQLSASVKDAMEA